jgi:hypothetical protein
LENCRDFYWYHIVKDLSLPFLDPNWIRSGTASITLTLTNSQYSFNYRLFDNEAVATNLLSAWTTSLPTSPNAWLQTVRSALLQNATSCIQSISETQIKINIPAVPDYQPENGGEVITMMLPEVAILPSTLISTTYSVNIGTSSSGSSGR